eukprot:PhF_6_TR41353/c0_g1_i1/m.62781/K10396/KIF5; kinesin family member 5
MSSSECVQVYVRARPINQLEIAQSSIDCVSVENEHTIKVSCEGSSTVFHFDHVFPTTASQADVYVHCAKPIVEDVFQGYNGTIFTYGQTGSGKTHTMVGPAGQHGIMLRSVHHLFDLVRSASKDLQFEITVSVVEIYNEKVRDLLNVANADLLLYDDVRSGGGGVYIKDCTELFITSPEEFSSSVFAALMQRATSCTRMNEQSSRSHCIVYVKVTQRHVESGETRRGKLFLVDLAGSEKANKTAAVAQTLKEAKNINRSLSCLTSVIVALTEKKSHVPYRDSKLTRLLQDSLGGNAKTALVLCCSSASYNLEEIIATLRFGVTAKKVVNKAKVNREETLEELQAMLELFLKEITSLRKSQGIMVNDDATASSMIKCTLQNELQEKRDAWKKEEESLMRQLELSQLKESEIREAANISVSTVESLKSEAEYYEEQYKTNCANLVEKQQRVAYQKKSLEFKKTMLSEANAIAATTEELRFTWEERLTGIKTKLVEMRHQLPEDPDGVLGLSSPDGDVFQKWEKEGTPICKSDRSYLLNPILSDAVVSLNEASQVGFKELGEVARNVIAMRPKTDDYDKETAKRQRMLVKLGGMMKQGHVPRRLAELWKTSAEGIQRWKSENGARLSPYVTIVEDAVTKEMEQIRKMEEVLGRWQKERNELAEKWNRNVPRFGEVMTAESALEQLERQAQKISQDCFHLRSEMQIYEKMLSTRNERLENLKKALRVQYKKINERQATVLAEKDQLRSELESMSEECTRWKEQAM